MTSKKIIARRALKKAEKRVIKTRLFVIRYKDWD